MHRKMGNTILKLAVMVLVLAAGVTARITYEQVMNPTAAALAQDDPRVGSDCEDFRSQEEAQTELEADPTATR